MTDPVKYSTLNSFALRVLCRERRLFVSGTASELRARLEADDARRAAAAANQQVTDAAEAPEVIGHAREVELRIGWLATNAGAVWHGAQQRVEEAARRLVAARGLGHDDGDQLQVLQRELAALDEAAAAYLTAARRALAGG
jgi:hypothetical protein